MMKQRIVAGNWKMNKNYNGAVSLLDDVLAKYDSGSDVKVIVAPPAIYLSEFSNRVNGSENFALAAQNVSSEKNGAFTGEVSAEMLSSLHIQYCLVGHSERRTYYNESNSDVNKKVKALLEQSITPIICIGETLEERESEQQFSVVKEQLVIAIKDVEAKQLKNAIVAYEPVWAIGTGKTASSSQAEEMHKFIHTLLVEVVGAEIANTISILYGGSCKPDNAKELFNKANIDGGLIGGAALEADSFIALTNTF
jgi:triosephosphate isomerase